MEVEQVELPSDDEEGVDTQCFAYPDDDPLARELADMISDGDDCGMVILAEDNEDGGDIRDKVDPVLPLPDDLCRQKCMCKGRCIEKVMEGNRDKVTELRDEVRDNVFLLDLVKNAHKPVNKQISKLSWRLLGQDICRDAFIVILGISRERMRKILASARTSGLCPYSDLRKENGGNDRNNMLRLQADAFWHFCYHYVAEPLADADERARTAESMGNGARMVEYITGREGNPLASSAMDLHNRVDRRFMPPMTWSEVQLMNQNTMPAEFGTEKASMQLLRRVYHQSWGAILGFRAVGQHARCKECARLAKTRRDDPDLAARQVANNEYKVHLRRVFAMRKVDMRFSTLSKMSCEPGCTISNRCLHIRIDGLDQAKGRCPRNLENSKRWSELWRPQLHIVGCVVEGLFETYWVMDADVRKDSGMECTCLSLAIGRAQQVLAERGLGLPEFLSIKYDNTAREGKNQIVAKWMSLVQHRGVFRQVQDGSGEPGHSHDPLDQRFSVIASHLAMCKVLQTPGDFVNNIRKSLVPIGGRKVFAEILKATWDWKAFFDPLEISAGGIAATHATPDVCFSKRFLQRRDLPKLNLNGWDLEIPEMYQHLEQSPQDVVMICKQFWSSDRLAQQPLLWIPHSYFDRLDQHPKTMTPRNALSDKQAKEYLKTAKEVVLPPWRLQRAGDYLNKWVDDNRTGRILPAPRLSIFEANIRIPVWGEEMAVEWQDYAPAPPARIEVKPAKRPRAQKAVVLPDDVPEEVPEDEGAPLAGVQPPPDPGDGEAAPLPDDVAEDDLSAVPGTRRRPAAAMEAHT